MKKFLSILTAALVLTASSCKKDYLELNKNPNAPSVTTPQLALAGALKTSADIVNGGGYVQYASWMGYLSWSTSFQANVALLSYQIQPTTYDIWTPLYQNITNYDALRKSTTEPYFQAISEIMTVFSYQALVDNYNNVAYTDATKGTAVLNPKYDKGSDVYDAILKRLDAAIVQIQTGQKAAIVPTSPGSSDVMYGGDMNKWLKFANTLKLRIALRQSNVAAKTAALKAAVAATQALGYIDNNSPAYVNPGYLNSDAFGGQQSPLWRNYGTTQNGGVQTNRNQYQANSYGATKLTANGDTRGPKVYTTTGANVITATALGVTTPPAVAPSKVGTGLLSSPTQSAIVISPSESYFLQAEGVKSGYITASTLTAQQAYNAGVTASFTYLGVAADAANYLTLNPYPVAGSDAVQQQAIINEKWKALAVYGAFEAFNEFRRTGYPNDIPLSVFPGANPPNQVTRIPYPQVEYTTNPGPVAGEGTISVFTSKIFWAK
ncbi:SusD/RagB family nutrient-binding outer membrane lipoprotein [Mucilaginibacter glaciei]|uniref:SusD/RagB family nutrient-binding outer membrane lipoprotein n=1 Tax=Mucilaginibacter glaciei TaxID=2772109 RepID=A0A926S1V6_9SPHI|nr:SusD/RagB family nutrient-binding outer membrane lipoprotein [Mucilaginibacter glaciei]MBD1393473.1 SusD/RagB family nutrient-binding outer membrane lipoprotein [Mucilaginibacter glaciei]